MSATVPARPRQRTDFALSIGTLAPDGKGHEWWCTDCDRWRVISDDGRRCKPCRNTFVADEAERAYRLAARADVA